MDTAVRGRDVAALQQRVYVLGAERDALAEANRDLAAVNDDLAVFAAAAAHDLKNPLGSVLGFAQMLHEYDDVLDEDGRSMLDRIEKAATRMVALVDDLLAYARAGSVDLAVRPVDLGELAARVVAEHGDTLEAGRGHVSLGHLPEVDADPTLVRQLLGNLLGNALKYTRPGQAPDVRMDAVRDSRGWVVRVTDHGIGIPREQHERVFAAFARLDVARDYAGTGLGLALCRRIVERHGGTIGVADTAGGGACFWFTLAPPPAAAGGAARAAALRDVTVPEQGVRSARASARVSA